MSKKSIPRGLKLIAWYLITTSKVLNRLLNNCHSLQWPIFEIYSMILKNRLSTTFRMPWKDSQLDSQRSENRLHDAQNDWISKAKNRILKAPNRTEEAQNLLLQSKNGPADAQNRVLLVKNWLLLDQNWLAQFKIWNWLIQLDTSSLSEGHEACVI